MDPVLTMMLFTVGGSVAGGLFAWLGIVVYESIMDWRDDRRPWCRKPGRGWYCTYAEGHLAECDVWPEWWMTLWVRLRWRSRS